jgi:hypothetical protein
VLERDLVGSLSYWARVSWNLRFNGHWRPRDYLLDENYSSLMLRADHLRDEFGGWDPVRVGADTELRLRVEAKYGKSQLPTIMPDLPWSFALEDDRSLTRRPATHVSTLLFGLRQGYRRAYTRWHAAASEHGELWLDPDPSAARRFPVPAPMLAAAAQHRAHDLLLVGDFAQGGDVFERRYHDVLDALEGGLRVGVFQWPRYDLELNRPIDERIAALVDACQVQLIVAGEPVAARNVVVHDVCACMHLIDRVPAISYESLYVVVHEPAESPCDPPIVRAHLETLFGSAGEWVPGSPAVQARMAADPRYPPALCSLEQLHARLRWRSAAPPLERHEARW